MRRRLTLALAFGLAALITVAAVDAFRGSGAGRFPTVDRGRAAELKPSEVVVRSSARPASWIEDRAGLARRLRRNGVSGTLYLSADGCLDGNARRLRALSLPELELAEGPRSRSCSFTVSANADDASGRAVTWSQQQRAILAAETGAGELEVVDVSTGSRMGLPGSAPAFRPDGTLTYVHAGSVVGWSAVCDDERVIVSPSSSLAPEPVGSRCSRTLVARDELARALPDRVRLRSVRGLVWTSSSRLLAALRTDDGPWLAGYEKGRWTGSATSRPSGPDAMRAGPDGHDVAVLAHGSLDVYDDQLRAGWSSPVETSGFDWSPDGEWLAYANGANVYLVRTSDWTTRFSIPVSTESLAWR